MKTCSFFGHRNTAKTEELKRRVWETVERLITEEGVDVFLFGSRSCFDDLCLSVVTQLQSKYPNVKRIYVRSQYAYVSDFYKKYLLQEYDDTFMPSRVENAGRASYVERNQGMIDKSDVCVFYYNPEYLPPMRKESKRSVSAYQPKSGTKLAFEYANQRKGAGSAITIINIYEGL